VTSAAHSPAVAHASYDPQFFAKIAAVEDRHFWFCARNRIIAAAAHGVVAGLAPGYRVLEVGCGTGVVLRQLVEICRGGEVIGMDLFPEAVAFASRRASCPVLAGDVLNPPELGAIDMVGIFDVLEHLPDDRVILRGLHRLLKPGGALLLTVPAHMSLWSYFDVSSCHCRRYERGELASRLGEAGFRIEYLTEFMTVLFPLVWAGRRLKGGKRSINREEANAKTSGELKVVPGMNGLLKAVLSLEAAAIARRWRLPKGTSLLAIARKPIAPQT
jgi:SAM-dependent methyltransferase